MNEFMVGVLTGVGIFGFVSALGWIKRTSDSAVAAHAELSILKTQVLAMATLVMKIDKTTQATMLASETFVDALRSSAEQFGFMGMPPRMPRNPTNIGDDFKELRNTFEEGINKFEDEDDDEDFEGPKEDWKKK